MKISRRNFLGLCFYSGIFLSNKNPIFANPKQSSLILIELRGGNDGLNTLIPYTNSLYFSKRPKLALSNFIKLNSKLALNPYMEDLLPLWKERKITFALGVGFPNPNRSHFAAQDQWSTGKKSGEGKGWMADMSDSLENENYLLSLGPTSSNAVEGGINGSLHLRGNEYKIPYNKDSEYYSQITRERKLLKEYLRIEKKSNIEFQKIKNTINNLPDSIKIPKGALGKQTKLALQLINTDSPPTFIQLEHGGYDTHQNQLIRQNKKLKELSENILALKKGSEKLKKGLDLNIIVTSEFGRRLNENGANGTDHGSASIAFMVGDSFKEEFIGYYPDLSQLDHRGDLVPNITPNDLYSYAKRKIWV